jgi:hypothetical protein
MVVDQVRQARLVMRRMNARSLRIIVRMVHQFQSRITRHGKGV